MSDSASVARTELWRVIPGHPVTSAPDLVAREEPLEIRVRGQSVAITMRTPGHDDELAAGFLVSEGILHQRSDIIEIAPCTSGENAFLGNILNIFLAVDAQFDVNRLTRHVFASSSCGLCGKASIESVHQHFPAVISQAACTSEMLARLPRQLREAQSAFTETGGLHAAGLFTASGETLVIREDVGRHNAVDKVIGWAFLKSLLPLTNHILMVSGRASFEILQKSLSASVPIIAAVSAPSSLAVDFAHASNQTLVGFLRGASFNIYTHPQRISHV